jgi:Fur family transcriptional regulator, zinc uptake regulator
MPMHDHTHTDAPLTKNQSMVLAALSEATGPLSAYALLDQLREAGFRAPPQVYRALDKLVELGLVHRLESINAFVACAHPHEHPDRKAAFAICDGCGQATEFEDPVIRDRLVAWATQNGFTEPRATIEIRGLCGSCAKAA